MKYSIVGLGKLGASMVAGIASRGLPVIGLDIDPAAVAAVGAGRAPVQETDLDATLAEYRAHISTTHDYCELVDASDLTFVIVPTPSDDSGRFSLDYLREALTRLGQALAHKQQYHSVVITSTVLPGSTRYGLLPVLEASSGKTCGRDFGLCYSPEFIALGSVIRDFLHPDFTLIGEFDTRSGDHLVAAYDEILVKRSEVQRMSFENAELTKVAVNAFITTKISFANTLSQICERIPGGNVDVVTTALGKDSRIGARYLKGALGYGGPCFPRDNQALSSFAEAVGVSAPIPRATDLTNRAVARQIAHLVRERAGDGATVAVLGLAYKPDSHVVEESQALQIIRSLSESGMSVVAYDPLAGETARAELGEAASVLPSIGACLRRADVVIITTPDRAFARLTPEDFRREDGERVVVMDLWRILAPTLSAEPNIAYYPYGCDTQRDDVGARVAGLWWSDRADPAA
ncbi:MAG: nucleotide sugar dehydrogenase [Myxococcales bacterium]|nr:nucleotide sugar dehydrogenase [Myxococcales bacterium]